MEELIKYGKKMVAQGLAHSHFGNVSKRIGDRILISTTGSMLDELEGQIVEVSLSGPSSLDMVASTELLVHKEIYRETSALSILHGHSEFAVVLSLLYPAGTELRAEDSESTYLLHEIPIIQGGVGSKELGQNAAAGLRDHKAVLIKGHGVFARGSTVDEAFVVLSSVEHSCKVKYFADLWNKKG
ncbi:MAG TPA: aldolase [Proteobacteria bacterium]|nr:aldolase [Pseudomonadota bacterium]